MKIIPHRRIVSALTAGMLVASAGPAGAKSAAEVFAEVAPSVVVVLALDDNGETVAQGSGVVVGKNEVATNCHVIEDAESVVVRQAADSGGGETYRMDSRILTRDGERDLCLLFVGELSEPPAAPVAAMGAAKGLAVGEEVYAIGAPEGLELSLSRGVVSQLRGIHGKRAAPLVQTDAAISPGSSGGGLFNADGELVGITTFKWRGESLNFAIPAEWVGELLGQFSAEAQNNLGRAHANDKDVSQNGAESVERYRHAAKQGNAYAQNNLGMMYANGDGVPQDYVEAAKWFRRAAEQGNIDAQFNLGWIYDNGYGVSRDHTEAMKWYRLSAEQGNAGAQFNLGVMYETGNIVPQDYSEAVKWFRRAAEQGYAQAQFNLGWMYRKGAGIPQDSAKAMAWFRRAAEQGSAGAQNNLGVIYEKGDGVPQNSAEAVKWYRRAAEQGNAEAQNNFGAMYFRGEGIGQDDSAAVKWFRRAAEQGNAQAQFNIGVMYSSGDGVSRSHREAYVWFSLAAEKGQKEAVEYRDNEARKLSAVDLFSAQDEVAHRRIEIRRKQENSDESHERN